MLAARVNSLKIYTYEYNGYFAHIDSLISYYKNSMELLNLENQKNLFYAKTGPIYTKTKDSPPTKYGMNAQVKHSIIASGCNIDGNIENSIIFRGVKIGKNSVVKNSILMPHTEIGENTQLDSIITDTYTFVKNGRTLLGYTNCPFFLKKYSIV